MLLFPDAAASAEEKWEFFRRFRRLQEVRRLQTRLARELDNVRSSRGNTDDEDLLELELDALNRDCLASDAQLRTAAAFPPCKCCRHGSCGCGGICRGVGLALHINAMLSVVASIRGQDTLVVVSFDETCLIS